MAHVRALSNLVKTGLKNAQSRILPRPFLQSSLIRPTSCHSQMLHTSSPLQGELPLTTLSEEEEMLKDMVTKFCEDKVHPLVSKMDEESKMDPSIITGLFEQGLMGIEVDPDYGGTGSTFFGSCLAIEQIASVDGSVSVLCDVHNTLICRIFDQYGTKEQKDEWLPRVVTDTVGALCLSEPNAGSDAFSLTTKAEKKGDDYILNGTKAWITNAEYSGVFLVFATVDLSKGYKGITCFLVPKDAEGLTVGKKEDKLGLRASSTCMLILEDVKVPASNVIGKVGEGYKIVIESLNEGRIGIAAQLLGLSQGCFDYAVAYTHDRKQFGQPIWEFQGMQHQIANIATQIEATRLLVYNAARAKDAGQNILVQSAMAKYYAAEVATVTTSKCVEWMGGNGISREYPIEKYYRDCKAGSIYEGTSNIQLSTIAKAMYK